MKTVAYDETKYKLVPLEPTPQMQRDAGDLGDGYELCSAQMLRIYQSIVATVPEAEVLLAADPSNPARAKVGDTVLITRGHEPYFKQGDLAVLSHRDSDGDWWGKFDQSQNIRYGSDTWCITGKGAFVVVPQPSANDAP